ncbi:MAG: phosphotransferase [Burkholderiales bacterium]
MTSARLIPSDPVLPQLASALDARAMRGVFERYLLAGGNSLEPTTCDIERVKYRPGRNCLIGYKLELREPATGARSEQRLCVGIYAPEEARARFHKASGGTQTRGPWFAPVSLIAPLDMVVWAFPHERKLGALPVMTDSARLREELLSPVVRAHWGDDWKIADVFHAVSCYFPEHSCTVNATLTLAQARGAPRRAWSVLGKTRYDDAGSETFRCMTRLWQNGDRDGASYARPLAYQPEHRLLWQERVPGRTLDSLLDRSILDTRPLARAARALAALHRTPLRAARRVAASDIAERLPATEALVARAQPSCAAVLARATGQLLSRAPGLDTRASATLHGDLHSNNILVDDARVYLIDLDMVSNGPPLAELGSLLAELTYRACLSGTALDALTPVLNHIVQAYRRAAPWPVADEEVDWYTAAALLNERAFRCVTSLKPGRMEILGELVDIAARITRVGLIGAPARFASGRVGQTARAAREAA